MVDPPSGWNYGFPIPLAKGDKYDEVLRAMGYPEKDIPLAMQYSWSWDEEISQEQLDKFSKEVNEMGDPE